MQEYIQVLIFVVIGILLLYFGYSLVMGYFAKVRRKGKTRPRLQKKGSHTPGDAQVCPICSSRLDRGDLVKTLAFPSITGGSDRLMHIRGCFNCLSGEYERHCPVCGSSLSDNEYLIARMFERRSRPHVHVLGCTRCRKK